MGDEHEAVEERARDPLRQAPCCCGDTAERRRCWHRDAWFQREVANPLEHHKVHVLADIDNGPTKAT